jgi:CRISPR-associated protein Cas1
MAYDGMNNLFNLAYEILAWKIHKALVRAKLEPYLGFLHSNQMAKLSLVCDFQELYRYFIDDFLINYCQRISVRDFKMKTSLRAMGRRVSGNT